MSTTFIQDILPTKDYAKINRIALEKSILFVHHHPTMIKIVKISIATFSLYLFVTHLTFFLVTLKSTFLTFFSGISFITSFIAHKMLNIAAPFVHEMKNHAFETFENDKASLFYKNDVPVLKIKVKDPFDVGFVQGYHLQKNIRDIIKNWSLAIQRLPSFMPFLHDTPYSHEVENLLEEVKKKIPEKYIKEMEGLVEGYNKKIDEKSYIFKEKKLTLNDVILFHLEPDIRHIKHKELEKKLQGAAACSTLVAKDRKNGIVFAHNTDWPSFSVIGPNSIVISKKSPFNDAMVAHVTVPGLVAGSLMALNALGLAVCMNICNGETKKVDGMPNGIFTRYVIDSSKDVAQVYKRISNKNSLGPYHLIAADKNNAQAFFIQQGDKKFETLKLSKKRPLVVTNFRYDKLKPSEKEADDINFSSNRENRIYKMLKDIKENINPRQIDLVELFKKSLSLPFVNNLLTAHSVVANTNKLELNVAFDNAYAAKNDLKRLSKEDLF